jgi:hypothetical protein
MVAGRDGSRWREREGKREEEMRVEGGEMW